MGEVALGAPIPAVGHREAAAPRRGTIPGCRGGPRQPRGRCKRAAALLLR